MTSKSISHSNVALASEALGSTATVGVVSIEAQLRAWSSTRAHFEFDAGEYNREALGIMQLSSGSVTTTSVGGEIGSVAADSHIFFSDHTSDDIMQWGTFGAFKRADTSGDVKGKLALDSTYVYWTDSAGLRRATRNGGAATTLLADAGVSLYGRDGSWLYYLRRVGSTYYLKKIRTDGTGNATIHTFVQNWPAFVDLTWDASNFYWVDNGPTSRRVLRLPKGGATAATTVATSSTKYWAGPVSNGVNAYWIEKTSLTTPSSAVSRIWRLNIAYRGELSIPKWNLADVTSLHLGASDLYFTEGVHSGSTGLYVRRAALP